MKSGRVRQHEMLIRLEILRSLRTEFQDRSKGTASDQNYDHVLQTLAAAG